MLGRPNVVLLQVEYTLCDPIIMPEVIPEARRPWRRDHPQMLHGGRVAERISPVSQVLISKPCQPNFRVFGTSSRYRLARDCCALPERRYGRRRFKHHHHTGDQDHCVYDAKLKSPVSFLWTPGSSLSEANDDSRIKISGCGRLKESVAKSVDSYIAVVLLIEEIVDTD